MMRGRRSGVVVVVILVLLLAVVHGEKMDVVDDGSSISLPVTPPTVPESAPERRSHFRAMAAKDLARHRQLAERSSRTRRLAPSDSELLTSSTSTATTLEMPVQSGMGIVNVGMYLVSVRIGTPPLAFSMVLDTANDITWINCRLRRRNGKHHDRPSPSSASKTTTMSAAMEPEMDAPLVKKTWYRPSLSSSWRRYRCSQRDACGSFPHNTCQSPDHNESCSYEQMYEDGTVTRGIYGRETATVPVSGAGEGLLLLPGLVLGCSTFEAGAVVDAHDGVLTLGNHAVSFGTVAAARFGGRFSFCLLHTMSGRDTFSYLTFGPNPALQANAMPMPMPMEETSLVYSPDGAPAFGAGVTGVFVDGQRLAGIPPEVWDHAVLGGGLNLDTGTSLTGLVDPAFEAVRAAVDRRLGHLHKEEVDGFDVCYRWTFGDGAGDEGVDPAHNVTVPKVAFEFDGGARLEPVARGIVLPEVVPGVACLGFRRRELGPSVLGNVHMQEHVWEFDHLAGKLRFRRDKCTSHGGQPPPSPSSSSSPIPPAT